jgi:Tfp pilus assembly protein PilF
MAPAKRARAQFEAALALDDKALDGSAYTSLGTLYHKMPGWPVGFGSDKKAREYLEKALQLSPTAIDPNYFYGEFLYDEGEYARALEYLEVAQKAPPRPGREIADAGRQAEIRALIEKTRKKLG